MRVDNQLPEDLLVALAPKLGFDLQNGTEQRHPTSTTSATVRTTETVEHRRSYSLGRGKQQQQQVQLHKLGALGAFVQGARVWMMYPDHVPRGGPADVPQGGPA